jgi:F420-0:gamma-glutamyl ligase
MIVKPIKTRIFGEGENLIEFINKHIKSIKDRSVIVITSKILALEERRVVITKVV